MKDIPGFEGRYAITEDGRVWSYPKRHEITQGGFHEHKGKWLSLKSLTSGYYNVNLTHDGRCKNHRVHQLVAKTYIPNPGNLPFINHKNGIKTDNRVENLEWCTPKENWHHAYSTGLFVPVRGSKLSKVLNDNAVRTIRKRYLNGEMQKNLALEYGISRTAMGSICRNEGWTHVK